MYPDKLLVMGVAGCGKSTLAAALARALDAALIEGDDHHPAGNRDKMRRGIALQDADRAPWLDRLGQLAAQAPQATVLTCSALKRRYRDRLRAAVPGLRIVYAAIAPSAAMERVAARPAHLFPASLVASQFDALEAPHDEPDVLTVNAQDSTARQVEQVLHWLARHDDGAPSTPPPATPS